MVRLITLFVIVFGSGYAHGTSKPPVVLTPKTIADQPHRLSVTASGDDINFKVQIGAKDPKAPLEVEWGYLTVYDGERLICASRIHAQQDKAGVVYEFTVASEYLSESGFAFSVATASAEERKKMPAGGGWVRYQFTLKDFVATPADGKKSNEGPRLKDVKMVFDPKHARINAFLEHLGRNGIKLAHEASNRGCWRVVEPKLPDGIAYFDICTFNAPASFEQMREAARNFSWGWQYQNVPAQLSMSETYGGEPGNEPSDDQSALHEKLRFLFYWYQRDRDKPPVDLLTNAVIDAGRDPKDERIEALVANLTKGGIKLEYSVDVGDWRIVEPKHADGTMSVSIRSFPIPASEEQMRWAVSGIKPAYQLNVSAHLAISHISMKDSAKGKTQVVEALEKKLLRLFHKHKPAGLGAYVGDSDDEATKELHALWDFFTARGIELKYVDNSSNFIQQLFSVGPDHGKRMCIGLNSVTQAKVERLRERYRDYPIERVARGRVFIFKVGGPNGADSKEYAAVWDKVLTAFKAFPGRPLTPDNLAPRAAGVAMVEVIEVKPYDDRPMDGNKGVSLKLKLIRGSGEFHESIAVDTEFGGHRAPNSPEPKPSGPVKADSLKKGQRYWVAFASPYEYYPAYPQGVIALWPEDDAKAAKVLDEAVKADHWKWRPQFHPKLGLTVGRLIEADKKHWNVRVWKGEKMLWEATIPGAQPAADRDFTPDWGFIGSTLMCATLRPLAADNEFSLPAKTYLVKTAFDPETGIRRTAWVDAESPPGVQLVRRDYDPKSRLLREERFDWLETGGNAVGAKTENWFRRIDRTFDPTTGKSTRENMFRWDDSKSGDERWVKVRP